tara:strand:+ start:2886 stop:3173 length:288 start_codon:yes stop_codon:yes gene_type:complete
MPNPKPKELSNPGAGSPTYSSTKPTKKDYKLNSKKRPKSRSGKDWKDKNARGKAEYCFSYLNGGKACVPWQPKLEKKWKKSLGSKKKKSKKRSRR